MKRIAITALIVLLVIAMATTALAHGGRGHRAATASYQAPAAGYALCPVEDCAITGAHVHDGVVCAGHYIGDGHDYHVQCGVANCRVLSAHEHGTYSGGGHGCGGNAYYGGGCRR